MTATKEQFTPYDSPWSLRQRVLMLVWDYAWTLLCRWTPKPLNPWRLLILRLFGAKIAGTPFVHQRARIQIPWNLALHQRACLGDRANIYSLAKVEVLEAATVAQEAYLCTGTHNLQSEAFELVCAPIVVGPRAFVGARAFVLPGISIGSRAVVGAMSVVTKDVEANAIVAGNPAKRIGNRA